jgi:trk system potassium uptake protein TrkA
MRIVIAGAGEVGSHLAKLLSNEEQDILLIDEQADKLSVLDANYNLMTFEGRPTSFQTLRQARVGNCDLFIAVTPYETDNIVACSMAKSLGAQCTVARIDTYDFMDPANMKSVKLMGVDEVIYPEYLNRWHATQRVRIYQPPIPRICHQTQPRDHHPSR